MLALDAVEWKQLNGGYRQPYDASVALRQMEQGEDVWEELWENLHHQGDVGEASYAAVPHLVRIANSTGERDWNVYSIISIIEIARHDGHNPTLPQWLAESYKQALDETLSMALADIRVIRDSLTLRSILGTIAVIKGELKLGEFILDADEAMIDEFMER